MPTRSWRLICQQQESYADINVGLRPALTRAMAEGKSPNTLVLATFEKHSLGITYYNDPTKDVDLEAARSLGVVVKSSGVSGGGSIYGNPGMVLALMYLRRSDPAAVQPDELMLMKLFCALADQLSLKYQLPVRFRPMNDGEIWSTSQRLWKKLIAGSITGVGDAMQLGAGIQVRLPRADIAQRLITPPAEKFQDKQVKNVGDRMGSLEEALGQAPSLDEVLNLSREAIQRAFGMELEPGQLNEVEREYLEEGYRLYDNEEWIFNRTERSKFGTVGPGLKRGEAITKIPGGPLLRVTLLRENDHINNILFTGSLHASPVDAFKRLEELLVGVRPRGEQLSTLIREFYAGGIRTPMVTPELLAETINKAYQNSLAM